MVAGQQLSGVESKPPAKQTWPGMADNTGDLGLNAESLSQWYLSHGRDLPWRRTRDPWAVLVSEVMLQQTQVDRVIPRWQQFLLRFPTAAACAVAPLGDVLALWVGLGYNRRALSLWRAANMIAERHDGAFPRQLETLLALPGVGPYTARAVLAFAFEAEGTGVLDTNVARILARRAGRPLGRAQAQRQADEAVPQGQVWQHNQALLDLGATVCTARAPRCSHCPLSNDCAWYLRGNEEPDPAVGSAGVSGRQSRFVGSDRQGRGRLISALVNAPVARTMLAGVMGWSEDNARAHQVLGGLVRDGLVVVDQHGTARLPGQS